eukprot:snap_masked-scaffold204_size260821-processed-gene-1.28 protein:Tk07827 transcript:snap_masked-scaffold204_size260821-processed-gene-1.28-mRNA-1 annotation:"cuticle protein 7"
MSGVLGIKFKGRHSVVTTGGIQSSPLNANALPNPYPPSPTSFQIICLFGLFLAAAASALPAGPSYHQDPYKLQPRPFQYAYGVADEYSGTNFDKKETQDEYGNVNGEYRVALPDGRTQIVSYRANHEDGFIADAIVAATAVVASALADNPAPYQPAPYQPAPYQPAPYKPAPYKQEYKEAPQPFAYQYGVQDGYSGADFNKQETQDAYGNLQGEYRAIVAATAVVASALADNPAPYQPAPYQPAPYKPAPYKQEYKEAPQPFAYQYGVQDGYSGADFNKQETQDAYGNLQGEYRVALPDGRTQIVTYTADHEQGYVADVKYEGEAQYPEEKPSAYKPAPYKPAPYKAAPSPYKPASYQPEPSYN